jgi:putative PEP-CTERM system histidine kinase
MRQGPGTTSAYPSGAFDLDKSRDEWAERLRQASTVQFRTGGNRLCVPLHARDRSLGFVVLADRVNGLAYTNEEFDLAQCCADQLATTLLTARLTNEVLAAKELEAFRAMSAFFVHDLKNVTSTLGLMLQNLPLHFDDPAFREDAFRGIEKTVRRMNSLIHRLSAFRQKVEIQRAPVDVNAVVDEAIQNAGIPSGVDWTRKTDAVPEILGDRNQLQSVVVNLLMNATDAVAGNGKVTIETRSENGCAVISVSDNGSGMSQEFISASLFRPFQSTKTNGLGIGMFQSKIIAEAHRGTIEVTSNIGVGTTFRLLLPSNVS